MPTFTPPGFMPPAGSVIIPGRPDISWGGAGSGWRQNGQPLGDQSITVNAVGAPGTMMDGAVYTGSNGVWMLPDKQAAQPVQPAAQNAALVPVAAPQAVLAGTPMPGSQPMPMMAPGYPASGYPYVHAPYVPTAYPGGPGLLGLPTGGALVLDLVSLAPVVAEIYTELVATPPTKPVPTGDTATDVANLATFDDAIAAYDRRGRQINAVVRAIAKVLGPRRGQ